LKNKYFRRSYISTQKSKQLLKCFSLDLTAAQAHKTCNIAHYSSKGIYQKLRLYIIKYLLKEHPEYGEFEYDQSYFAPRRIRGKPGRGAVGKTPVFGVLKRGGKVYVEIVKNCSREELLPIIEGKILEGSTIHTDGWRAYDGLLLNGYDHYGVFHGHEEFAEASPTLMD
jgi:transposase-like protein